MRNEFVSVVIPAFNEAMRLPSTVRSINDYLTSHVDRFEIIIVNDGSTDGTLDEIKSLQKAINALMVLSNDVNKGKGYSVKRGVLASSGTIILTTDADLSTPIDELKTLYEWLQKDFDIAIGSRGLKESAIITHQPWYREMMGKTFNLFVRALVLKGIKDTQCGFKLFRSIAAKGLFPRSIMDGFSFDVEILFMAEKKGYRIKEVPIRWANSPYSTVSIIRAPLSMFIDLFRIKLNHLLGVYI